MHTPTAAFLTATFLIVSTASPTAAADIAFVALKEGVWHLHTTGTDGADTRQLTQSNVDARSPSWSSDRARIAFSTTAGIALAVGSRDGTVVDSIALDGLYIWQVCFAPGDSTYVLVVGDPREVDQTWLATCGRSGHGLRELLRLRTPVYHLAVDRTTGRVLFCNMLCGSACKTAIQEVWLTSVLHGQPRQLTLANALCGTPVWLPDGTAFLYTVALAGTTEMRRSDLMLPSGATVGSPSRAALGSSPSVSPDGRMVVYTRDGSMFVGSSGAAAEAKQVLPFPDSPHTRIKDTAWY
jgi:Tol biopolymer transport system component